MFVVVGVNFSSFHFRIFLVSGIGIGDAFCRVQADLHLVFFFSSFLLRFSGIRQIQSTAILFPIIYQENAENDKFPGEIIEGERNTLLSPDLC